MSVAAALAPTPLLQLRGIETFYGKIQALRGVDIDVNKGEIVTLIGANGAGKSTTMMTIFGAPRARRGRITFDGQDITNLPTHMISRLSIAQSPEGRRIFPRMTVFENLQMGASINNFAHFDEDLQRVFALFPRLKERAPQRGGTLSGGEQQMLAIARALMSRPRLLLLDEPSLGLAPLVVKQIFEVIAELNKTRGTDRLPGRAERLSCAQARPSRLCHGQRRDHDAGRRRGVAGAPGGARRLSRGGPLMAGILWADEPYGLFTFVLITLVLGGLGAWATGRAMAQTWRPLAMLAPYMVFLTAGVRFLHYALYGEPLLSPTFFIIAYIWTMAVGALGYRCDARDARWRRNIPGLTSARD